MMPSSSFSGQHALVTGAASGIGRATAIELGRRGARLTLVDIDARGLLAAAEDVRRVGARVATHVVDIADARTVAELAARILADAPVDLLVNNAGVAVVAPFATTSPDDWDWILGVNVLGPLRLTRALLPPMIRRGNGHLVVVASLAGLVGAPGMVAYSTTKFALVGFAEALRLELADTGVHVTAVCPGYVRTNLSKATRYDNATFQRFVDDAPAWYGMRAEHVGRRIADAVESRAPLLVLGPEKLGWWLKRVSPEAAFRVARWTSRRTGIGGGTGISKSTREEPCTSR